MIDTVIHGDCLTVLKTLDDNSIDSIVTDPPAGIAFMGKDWDNPNTFPLDARSGKRADGGPSFGGGLRFNEMGKRERDAFIAFIREVMTEALRVLKPGGHALVWALPRTSHWTATALEDAGFEVREKLYHLFGSGFPKSTAIDKQIDKMLGKEREVIGIAKGAGMSAHKPQGAGTFRDDAWEPKGPDLPVTAPATPEAQHWQGWGTATKPSVEEWILCRKPLAEHSIAANVLKYGTGGINVDATRIEGTNWQRPTTQDIRGGKYNSAEWKNLPDHPRSSHPQGRFPSHLLLSHSIFCTPTHEDESCPIRALDEQSGVRPSSGRHGESGNGQKAGLFGIGSIRQQTYFDQGGASRYFTNFPPDDFTPFLYTSKASRRERNAGCEGLPEQRSVDDDWVSENRKNAPSGGRTSPQSNHHPTVKSIALMRWLIRLITPPGGVVLDCFAGSGSTCVAAIHEGVHFIGIEQSSEYVQIAEARIAHAQREAGVTQAQEYDCAPDCPIRILGEQSGETGNNARPNQMGKEFDVHDHRAFATGIKKTRRVHAYADTGTAARYFQQFPPDSLFTDELAEVS